MLDTATKRRIDSARDILVGKVPDPKSQVEQITIALIYKFMDDMDAESEELGGVRTFFTKEFARYGWAKLMRSGLGGHETLNLYAEAISSMPENPGIPALFRSIFKNAYLPYRDPETLKSFLKIIDEFEYDHSERLGDAFEYLLSVLGSQGDAGQFRTPRHIIDFIVAILDPKKEEKILDPACGTAGFLISAYKHILRANSDADGNSLLTPDDKGRLAQNINGYDISPDMVRLSLVNLYLHGFADPHIDEYDTLTSLDKWNEHADVILANPPFMSPKGGIKPHKRFSIQATRSEVLFVDYMAEHLKPNGRAGIIVPEGIIFQSGTAYKSLRKMLVDTGLVAVISLPAGVFQPYSGVKTSIIILDKSIAQRSNTIAFFKVDNDGFGLGAQRRAIVKNDLPTVAAAIAEYLGRLRSHESVEDLQLPLGLIVPKEKIAENGDYNLSGERYREDSQSVSQRWPFIELEKVCIKITDGSHFSPDSSAFGFPYVTVKDLCDGRIDLDGCKRISEDSYKQLLHTGCRPKRDDVLFSKDGTVGKTAIIDFDNDFVVLSSLAIISPETSVVLPKFLYCILSSERFISTAIGHKTGVAIRRIVLRTLKTISIPLPPLEVQKEIVAEIEGYQKVIDGARDVLDNYRPHIPINPDWPIVELSEACEINPDTINPYTEFPNKTIFYIDISSVENETGRFLGYSELAPDEVPSRARRGIRVGDVLLSTVRPNLKAFTLLKEVHDRAVASTGFAVLRARVGIADAVYILASVSSDKAINQMVSMMGKGAYPSINQSDVSAIQISLPPLETQQSIVAEIEAEQALVAANRELIERFEKKIQATIARVWGGDDDL